MRNVLTKTPLKQMVQDHIFISDLWDLESVILQVKKC